MSVRGAGDALQRIVRRVLPTGPGRLEPGYVFAGDGAPYGRAFVALAAIPRAGIRAGDVVLYVSHPGRRLTQRERGAIRATVVRIPRAFHGDIVAQFDALTFVEGGHFTEDYYGRTPWGAARDDLQRNWRQYVSKGMRWKDATSPVWILRPWGVASQPIRASDDTIAIASLIQQSQEDA